MQNNKAGIMEKDVEFDSCGHVLRGVLTSGAESFSNAVITIHGWGGNRSGPQRMFVLLARDLADENTAVLRFDLQGRGVSDPLCKDTSVDEMIANVISSVDFLKSNYGVEKVSLIGICSGGNVALGAASLLKEIVEKVICISTLPFQPPCANLRLNKTAGLFKKYFKKIFDVNNWRRLIKNEINFKGVGDTLSNAALGDSQKELKLKTSSHDIMKELKNYHGEVILLYGADDPQSKGASEILNGQFAKTSVKIRIEFIENADHNFYSAASLDNLQKFILKSVHE